MGYDHFFHFIKDDLVDPNNAFIQNVDNFLFVFILNTLTDTTVKLKKKEIRF